MNARPCTAALLEVLGVHLADQLVIVQLTGLLGVLLANPLIDLTAVRLALPDTR